MLGLGTITGLESLSVSISKFSMYFELGLLEKLSISLSFCEPIYAIELKLLFVNNTLE